MHASLKPTNLQESFREVLYMKIMRDHIAGKEINSLMNHYNRVHKFVPVPQAMKMLDAKAAVEKQRKNSRKYWHGS